MVERQHDVVLGRGGLQLEVELAAEALAQRQAPGAVDAAAEGRMDDELHAARLVEEALEHDRVLASAGSPSARMAARRYSTSCSAAASPMPTSSIEPAAALASGRIVLQVARPSSARKRDTAADSSSLRPGASPSQNGMLGGCAVRVLHAHDAALDAQDAVGGVAELEHVAGHALDGRSPRSPMPMIVLSGSSST